jgi:hypothetical protein
MCAPDTRLFHTLYIIFQLSTKMSSMSRTCLTATSSYSTSAHLTCPVLTPDAAPDMELKEHVILVHHL